MNYWLFKSEPSVYGIDDLAVEKHATGRWDGIRNYQARNLLRDQVQQGDQVFFYQSSCKDIGIAGIMTVNKAAYPDPAQFNQNSSCFDAKASPANPRWYCVDVTLIKKFPKVISLASLKENVALREMALFRQPRLSIQPVTYDQWHEICKML